MSEPTLYIGLDDDLAEEAVEAGVADWVIPQRSAADDAFAILGVAGSIIAVLQTPKTLKEFGQWIMLCAGKRNEDVIIRVVRDGKKTTAELSKDLSPAEAGELVKRVLQASSGES